MAVKFSPTSNIAKLIIVVELILVIYLLNTLTVSVYRGYQIDNVIAEYETENRKIEDDNRKKSEDFDYFTSPNYIEKIAKQNMGLINQGEELLIIKGIPKYEKDDAIEPNVAVNDMSDLSNRDKWWVFFFDRN
jgi:cell division protein FtsB